MASTEGSAASARWARAIATAIALVLSAGCSAWVNPAAPSASLPTAGSPAAPATAATASAGSPSPLVTPSSATPAPASPTAAPATPTANPSPTPTATPAPTPTATAAPVRAGAAAYVRVAVAAGWRSSASTRRVDAPALANPVRLRDWLAAMTLADERGLIDRADTQLLLGEQAAVLAVRGGWAQVVVSAQPTPLDARGYPVWVPLAQLTTRAPPTASSVATVVRRTAWLEAADGPNRIEVSFGTTLPVVARRQGSVELGLPDGRRLWIDDAAIVEHRVDAPALPATASSVLASARLFLGLPYLWAGTSGFGLDCSGLVYLVYRAHGVNLPRDAEPQSHAGRAVALSALRPGDLVFFARDGVVHHVAIWAGSGKLIEAPKIGAGVRLVALASLPYAEELSAARRVLP